MHGGHNAHLLSDFAHKLLLLNLCLQLFDGLATYQGLQLGWQEGNPLLRSVMEHWGVGVTLFVFKMKACTLLLFLHQLEGGLLSITALVFAAVCYFFFSFIPWLSCLVLFPLH